MALHCYCLNLVFETHYLQENVLNKYFINPPFVVNRIWKQMSDSSFQTMADEGEYHLIISKEQVRWALMNTRMHKPSQKTRLLCFRKQRLCAELDEMHLEAFSPVHRGPEGRRKDVSPPRIFLKTEPLWGKKKPHQQEIHNIFHNDFLHV